MRLGFLASYNGSSMRAIVHACNQGMLDAVPMVVISNRSGSSALSFAESCGLRTEIIHQTRYAPYASEDEAICATLKEAEVDVVVLSGYMRKLGQHTLLAYRDCILNVHPALLPKYGGKGMYGLHVHEAVIAAGETETGATIHLVDEEYDHGRILAQRALSVQPGDTPETLAERVKALEATLFVEVLQAWSRARDGGANGSSNGSSNGNTPRLQ
ncbi:MAG: phosphoribosylglycinamide formyltransferase [Alicyclobacillaceae bacterium]|nr:phosphoribosylglycinamide formyltransferase [Alicyclobacillaceae bacterium]MCY0895435.1 phosphoribosylglycinamide formyltransferase [Alicyclobacillaceae bacterium]